ncbi:MAG TPA: transglutaminase family protein [Stellaceae bacterium]|nr:transglutaminase family protein [Stellaceae bacterium]
MRIRVGYELVYESPQPTPMLLMLSIHPSRAGDLLAPDPIRTDPEIPVAYYRDSFGNICGRIVAPAGRLALSASTVVRDSGAPDDVAPDASMQPIAELPDDSLVFLLGSRYCETDRLSDTAWSMFGATPPGWARVQAICDFVHEHIAFGYQHARATKTAMDVFGERQGVCRDFAHLAVALCRCMSIPARYCTGYLGDIGVPPDPAPMDFSAWFEAYLGGRWYTFDARHNVPRIGRILIARGRDAADVALTTSFGPTTLAGFKVVSDEVAG